jgi:hypothetical protein
MLLDDDNGKNLNLASLLNRVFNLQTHTARFELLPPLSFQHPLFVIQMAYIQRYFATVAYVIGQRKINVMLSISGLLASIHAIYISYSCDIGLVELLAR